MCYYKTYQFQTCGHVAFSNPPVARCRASRAQEGLEHSQPKSFGSLDRIETTTCEVLQSHASQTYRIYSMCAICAKSCADRLAVFENEHIARYQRNSMDLWEREETRKERRRRNREKLSGDIGQALGMLEKIKPGSFEPVDEATDSVATNASNAKSKAQVSITLSSDGSVPFTPPLSPSMSSPPRSPLPRHEGPRSRRLSRPRTQFDASDQPSTPPSSYSTSPSSRRINSSPISPSQMVPFSPTTQTYLDKRRSWMSGDIVVRGSGRRSAIYDTGFEDLSGGLSRELENIWEEEGWVREREAKEEQMDIDGSYGLRDGIRGWGGDLRRNEEYVETNWI